MKRVTEIQFKTVFFPGITKENGIFHRGKKLIKIISRFILLLIAPTTD